MRKTKTFFRNLLIATRCEVNIEMLFWDSKFMIRMYRYISCLNLRTAVNFLVRVEYQIQMKRKERAVPLGGLVQFFCVACVAWQTQGLCCQSASSMSSYFLFPFSNFWRNIWISFKFCGTLYYYKVQVRFNIGNHPPNFGWVMALLPLSFCCLFLLSNFWRAALISFKLCRTL